MTAQAPTNAFKKTLNAIQISSDPAKFFIEKLNDQQLGFFLSMPGLNQALMATTAEGAKEILQAPSTVLTSSLPSPLEPLLGKWSLILLQGEHHDQERKLIRPAFQGACLRSYVPLIQQAIGDQINATELNKPVDIQKLMHEITLSVIIEAVFGVTAPERQHSYKAAIRTVLKIFSPMLMLMPASRKSLGGLSPWDRFVKAKQHLNALLLQDIAAAREGDGTRKDILSTLVTLKDQQGKALSDQHILDQLITLLAAGHETTANSLAWAVYQITAMPEVMVKLQCELDLIDGNATIEQIMKLNYLDAVLKEVLRLYPVVPLVMRSVVKPCEMMGHMLDKGTYAGIATYALHMNPNIWQHPEKFYPQRFLENDYSPFEYVPFGGGNKKCLGYGFALFEMKLVLFHLFKHYRLALSSHRLVLPSIQGITLGPKQPIQVDLKPIG